MLVFDQVSRGFQNERQCTIFNRTYRDNFIRINILLVFYRKSNLEFLFLENIFIT